MKNIIILTLVSAFQIFFCYASVPISWTVETSRLAPAVFDVVRGETIDLEATFNSSGKPFAVDTEPVSIFWQTNGMGSAWWTAPAAATSNRVSATFTPEMDPGAATVNGFLGSSGSIYRAAFTFRFRHGPGATPNVLPLPTPVIDFAKVRVLNPPWEGGGVNTNAVIDIIHETVSGSARSLPKYLHERSFDDSYPDEAKEYYRSRGNGKTDGGCSAVRDGGFLYRNFDYPFDDRAEFVVKMTAGPNRFASVGVAQVGTNLTEAIVTSGKPSRCYKWLPGATVDGINENGVVAEINVVDGDPQTSGWLTTGNIHPLAAVRWALDNGTSAGMVASNLAARIAFPSGLSQNFHYMIADETTTYIVENGSAHDVTDGVKVMTNFRLYPTHSTGEGQERYIALTNGANITSQWWTLTYTANGYRASDLPGITGEALTRLFNYWENNPRESHRGEKFGTMTWWQSVHTSIYDITDRVLRVAVQETDDWYTFAVPVTAQKIDAYTKAETDAKLAEKIGGGEVPEYERDPTVGLTNGTIHINGQTITPLTEHQDVSGFVPYTGAENDVDLNWHQLNGVDSLYASTVDAGTVYALYVNVGNSGASIYEDSCDYDGWYRPFFNTGEPMASLNEVGVKTWAPNSNYDEYDLVLYGGDIYRCIERETPSPSTFDPSHWEIPYATVSQIAAATNGLISASNPAFSNAVLAVQISTNDFAALYELKQAFADLPIDPVTGGISLGALLAALASAVAWLKKNKVQTLKLEDESIVKAAENGVAKLDDFFKDTNSLLMQTMAIPFASLPANNTTSSYKRFRVTVSDNMTITLHTPTSGDAEIFECRFDGSGLTADKSISFSTSGATATTMDTDCGTVKAGKIALMSAFWNGTTWDVNWKVEG